MGSKQNTLVSGIALIMAGGMGTRMGNTQNKQLMNLCGKPVLLRTLEVFQNSKIIKQIYLVCENSISNEVLEWKKQIPKLIYPFAEGGETRSHSVENGLKLILKCGEKSENLVMIHDGARPLITISEIEECFSQALEFNGAAIGIPCKDTIKKVNKKGFISEHPDRTFYWQIRTPQCVPLGELLSSIQEKRCQNISYSDDTAYFSGKNIKMVEGSSENIKITTPDDLILAELILAKRES